MKVISIKQPFASLIVEGYKEYEFRTWKTKYRGEICIHASKNENKYAFHITNIEKIDNIDAKGQLGIWNYKNKDKND